MKRVAIIQARMGSTRLPGKVMKMLAGRPVLEHVVSRVQKCSTLDEITVASTLNPIDEPIVKLCHDMGIMCFRGSEEDVLDRYFHAAKYAGADIVVRITSDCPLIDPVIADDIVKAFMERQPTLDYLSNTLARTFPRGLDTEVFSFVALEKAWRSAVSPAEREHVTPYIYRHPDFFSVQNFSNSQDLSGYRWTLDTYEDWELIRTIYDNLYYKDAFFSTDDVLELMCTQPELLKLNAGVEQKETGR